MRKIHILFLVASVTLLLTVEPKVSLAQNNQQYLNSSTQIKGYGFIMVSPQEEGWYKIIQDPGHLGLGKIGATIYESYAVTITFFQLPQFSPEQDFADYIRKERNRDINASKRHKLLENKEEFPCGKENCVAYHTLVEDRGVKNLPKNRKYMLLEMQGFYCLHTKGSTNIGVQIEYSHRFFPENKDPEFEKKAKNVLDQIQFVEFQ